ncbi:glycosyltransferase [Flavihumibacter sp. R14]|nr:glycosyltransferase [Flavihumibacter soli]
MKILHIIFSLNVGGAETMLVDIVNRQAETDQVHLIVINNSFSSELIDGIKPDILVYFVKRPVGSLNILKILQLNYLVFKIQPDIIHFHDHNAIRLVRFKGTAKTCLTVHDVNKPIVNFKKYDRLYSISDAVKNDILRRSLSKSTRIYNGIDFNKVKRRKNYDFKPVFKIVQVGRLHSEKKGQNILLHALGLLINERHISNIRLDFIGDGPSLAQLQELSTELKISGQVAFLGVKTREQIYNDLRDYHLLVQPSYYEGFGLTVIEGIAAGLPVIVSNVDGPAEIIEGLPSAWRFELTDVWTLADHIVEIIELYRLGKIETRCHLSYLTARNKFSIVKTAHNYVRSYHG